jgi:hypothetical protein
VETGRGSSDQCAGSSALAGVMPITAEIRKRHWR